MKIIDTSKAVDPNKQQPFSTRSLYFLQNGIRENYRYLASAIVGSSYDDNTPYVIDGCVLSNANKDITDGHIFYNGGIYTVHAMTGSTGTPIRFKETLTPDATADPTTFSDGTLENVHIDHDYNALDSATVTYDFSATDLVYINLQESLTLLNSWSVYFPCKYTKVGSIVNLSGAITKSTDNSGAMFSVPAPSSPVNMACMTLYGGAYYPNVIRIDIVGSATLLDPVTTATYVLYLDGCSYAL
jgi:hypothetical protein